jgi:hypothetical protein
LFVACLAGQRDHGGDTASSLTPLPCCQVFSRAGCACCCLQCCSGRSSQGSAPPEATCACRTSPRSAPRQALSPCNLDKCCLAGFKQPNNHAYWGYLWSLSKAWVEVLVQVIVSQLSVLPHSSRALPVRRRPAI